MKMTVTTSMTNSQKTVLSLYAVVMAGSVLMMIPHALVPSAGLVCVIVGLIAAYIYRANNKDDIFMTSHMCHITRTIWWLSLLLLVGLGLFMSIIWSNGDLSMITNLVQQAEQGVIPNESDVYTMQVAFIHTNKPLIMTAAAVSFLPYPVFLIWRVVKGVRLSLRGDAYPSA